MNAGVLVAGGLNNYQGTCPFEYQYIDNYTDMVKELQNYDGVLYHWPPAWAVNAIRDAGILSVEFVHRVDTAECDKHVPDVIVSHSQYVCDYIRRQYSRDCQLVPNVVDTDFYVPQKEKKNLIGAVTSYYDTKGIDILIKAWAIVSKKMPCYEFHLYGAGAQKKEYEQLAKEMSVPVYFHDSIANSKIAYDQFKLVVSASRIEGLPIALLEALACNLPILASDIEGHKIINTLAVERGFDPPIKLFESENVEDLADKLYAVLLNIDVMKVETRKVALGVFSAIQHIDGINHAFYVAQFCHRNSQRIFARNCVQETEQCYIYDVKKNAKAKKDSIITNITNENYVWAEMMFKPDVKCMMLDAQIEINEYCNIYTQVDWIYTNGIKSEGDGIYLDRFAKRIFSMKDIPENTPIGVSVSIRPNPGENFNISAFKLCVCD